jgi:AraC-like DNA-binding protein
MSAAIQQKDWPRLAHAANYSVAQCAALCGLSVRHFERYCLKNTGTNPQAYLNALRLETAVGLLQKGSSVKEVAYQLGYKHPQNFSRKFKITFGVSPSYIPKSPS